MSDKRHRRRMKQQRRHESFVCRFIDGEPGALYDIGVGPKTEWKTLSEKYPGMKVFGCEPLPHRYEKLAANGFPGPLENVAIGEGEGVMPIYFHTQRRQIASMFAVRAANATHNVEVWTLDRFDEHMGKPDRILLWMDIEGSELTALRSGKELLASGRVHWINVEERLSGEMPAPGWCKPEDLHDYLTQSGFERAAEYNNHRTHQDAVYVKKQA